jgi:hypothetical protein
MVMSVTTPAAVARERRFIAFTPPLHSNARYPVKRKVSRKKDSAPAGHPGPCHRTRTVNVHFGRRIAFYFSENTDIAKAIGAI